MQWVFAINLFFAIYAAIVLRQIQSDFFEKFMFEIQILPVILIGLFGVSSLFSYDYCGVRYKNTSGFSDKDFRICLCIHSGATGFLPELVNKLHTISVIPSGILEQEAFL